jgi:hypothetical protein
MTVAQHIFVFINNSLSENLTARKQDMKGYFLEYGSLGVFIVHWKKLLRAEAV